MNKTKITKQKFINNFELGKYWFNRREGLRNSKEKNFTDKLFNEFISEYESGLKSYLSFKDWLNQWNKSHKYKLTTVKQQVETTVKQQVNIKDNMKLASFKIDTSFISTKNVTLCKIDKNVNKMIVEYCKDKRISFYSLLNSVLTAIIEGKIIPIIDDKIDVFDIETMINRILKEKDF